MTNHDLRVVQQLIERALTKVWIVIALCAAANLLTAVTVVVVVWRVLPR